MRGIAHTPRVPFQDKQGRFGRLFPHLPAHTTDRETLLKLANSMKETADNCSGDSRSIPAGFTFFGQFIDHDITLDVTSSLEQQNDPTAIRNFRTPVLELDSVYGKGPEADPFLYEQKRPGSSSDRLLTGNNSGNEHDLPRNKEGVALIGDPRNDEHAIISQMQLIFLKFHNVVYEMVKQGKVSGIRYHEDNFEEAQRLVRWHYQWIVVHEFLPLIINHNILQDIWHYGLKYYHWNTEPFMPVEFAVAAYRYGHSQLREHYTINAQKQNIDLFEPPEPALSAFKPLPPEFVVDWKYFFPIDGSKPQPSRLIDTKLTEEVFQLPFIQSDTGEDSLVFRNLLRGQSFGLPSGEAVACALGVDPLTPQQLGISKFGLEQSPLWYYILKEAELSREDQLGPVGGRIVAEVLIGLLKGDPMSFLAVAPCWKPCLPAAAEGYFTMADLIKLAQPMD
jgi:hypothetical protein